MFRPPQTARPIRFVPVPRPSHPIRHFAPPNTVNRPNQRAAPAQSLMDKFLTRSTPRALNDNNSDEEIVEQPTKPKRPDNPNNKEQSAKPKRPDNPLNKLLDCAQLNGDHYTCINAAQVVGKNFNGYRIVAQFELNKLGKSVFPDLLKEIFSKCLVKIAAFCTWTQTLLSMSTRLGDLLPEGNQLGELKDVYTGKEISAYCALGPKAYMLLLYEPVTGKKEVVKKCWRVLLHYTADSQLDYVRVRQMVLNAARFPRDYNCEEVENRDKNFRITRDGHIFSTPIVKKVRPTYFKGVLRGHRIVPFGFVHNQ